jgi:DNA repair exonuclease SbcCD nuclease subunit
MLKAKMQLTSKAQEPMRLLQFTDIHFGARSNSEQHLDDCLAYIDWFCALAKSIKATHISFLGDWYENRSAINVRTLKYSQVAARRLNDLGIPVIFIIGNHDLYHRQTREVFSTDPFADLKNFIIVSEPMEITPEIFASPFLFRDEYPDIAKQLNSYKYVLGHFEFRDFVVSGTTRTLEHGPDASQFTGPKYIFSGHFHLRQVNKNVIYIGNTFPTTFGDAWDSERGACLLCTDTEEVQFFDYPDAPLFYTTKLSQVLSGDIAFAKGGRVRCLLDVDIGYSDVQALKEEMMLSFELREFSVQEDLQSKTDSLNAGIELDSELDMSSLDSTVRQLIHEGVTPTATIDPAILIELYEELRPA